MRTFPAVSFTALCTILAGCAQLRPVDHAPFRGAGDATAAAIEAAPAGAAPAAPAPAAAGGADISYTYAEAGANFLDVDDLGGSSEDVDAYYIEGSLALGSLLHVFGSYENQSTDFQNTDTAFYRLGAGAHIGLVPNLDVTGDISWLFSDIESDNTSIDGTNHGYQVRGGARWMALGWDGGGLELEGNLIWIDIDDLLASDDEVFGWEAGARVHLFGPLSVGGVYQLIDGDDELLGVNARVSF